MSRCRDQRGSSTSGTTARFRPTEKIHTVVGFDLGLFRLRRKLTESFSPVKVYGRFCGGSRSEVAGFKRSRGSRGCQRPAGSLELVIGRCRMPRFCHGLRGRKKGKRNGSALPLLRKDPDDGAERQPRAQRHEPQMAPEPAVGARRGRWEHATRSSVFALSEVGEGDQARTQETGIRREGVRGIGSGFRCPGSGAGQPIALRKPNTRYRDLRS